MMNLAAEMARLPEPKTDKHPPDWAYWRWDLWRLAQNDSPYNFTKWAPVHHCMLVDHWKSIVERAEMPYVDSKAPNFRQEIQPFNGSDFLNYIHQAYHILRWQEATGLNIAGMDSIYEFGGGYGAMALVCNRLGFKGKYYIYDLPEFALLQRWYLEQCGVNVEHVREPRPAGEDLLIACYSLSETDYDERNRFLDTVKAGSYLFLYSNVFEKFDNIGYFQNLDFGKRWQHSHIDHLPPESWYTFGW